MSTVPAELMLLGSVSLLLVVFQGVIQDICIDKSRMERSLPYRGASSSAVHHHRSIFSIFA
jgi:mlo protein